MTTPERKPISDTQQELLSAYLDNQLGGVERAALERSLAADAALRAELEELRTVRQLLRALPAPTPPRSFTLSSAQARPRALPLFGWLRASSALAALLLMLTFLPGLLGGAFGRSSAPSAAMGEAATTLESPLSQAREAATVAPAAGAAEAPALKATPGSALLPAPEGAPAPMAAAEPTAAAASDAAASDAAATPTAATVAAAQATDIVSNSTASGYAATPDADQSALVESTRTAMDAGDAAVSDPESSSEGTAQLPAQPAVPGQPLPPLRWVQLALAALAVALGIGALLARRAGR
jgi:hypothetical protein